MRNRIAKLLGISVVVLLISAASVAQPAAVPMSSVLYAPTLRIGAGDLLDIAVFDSPELSGKLRVSEAGEVTLPIGGVIRVDGLTAEAAGSAIAERLRTRDIMTDPHVTVFISEYATQGVTVTGEVRTPGVYPLLGAHGLLDLISAAGGPTPTASRQATVIHRGDPQHPEIVPLDFHAGSYAQVNYPVQPGDTVVLARAGVVYVLGDVGHPGGFLLEQSQRLTALQAVSLAGGANKTAAYDRAKLIHQREGARIETDLPLKKMLANKIPDVLVADGDIVYLPPSGSKVAASKAVDAALAITTGVLIYGR
jgi:polysaccharide export outer membrane protein